MLLHNASHSKYDYIFYIDKMHINIETALRHYITH